MTLYLCARYALLALASCVLLVTEVSAQVALSHAQPAAILPVGHTRLYLHGDKFAAPLRVLASVPLNISVVEVTPNRVTLDVEPQSLPLMASGFTLMVASPTAISPPLQVLIDDLPSIVEASDNHLPQTAQSIGTSMAIDATCDGKLLDYFRFHADKDQAVTFEVLSSSLGSPCDPVVRILSEDGHVIRNIDDDAISPESRFRHTFSQAGNYLLEVHDNRFTAGGRYRVRLGNFPLVRFAYPAVIARGQSTTLVMAGPDRSLTAAGEVTAPTDPSITWLPVAARFSQGGSPSSTLVRVSEFPQVQESEPNNKAEEANVVGTSRGINGLLEQPGDHDFFRLSGVKDQTWRVAAKTRSLGTSTILKMTLRNSAGEVIGKTAVADSDEWQFDVKFAADGEYVLEVEDLLGRGGPDHGYHIEAGIAAPFSLALKPDPKTRDRFALQPTGGAAALDLVVGRNWNNGPIELKLQPQLPGLSIVNPLIPADAKEAKVFLITSEGWNPQSISDVQIIGTATQAPLGTAVATSAALLTLRMPHIPFPNPWQDGAIALVGVSDQPAFFEVVSPSDPVSLPRSLPDGSVNLTIKRVEADFKEPVYLLRSEIPAEWSAVHKLDKDTLSLAIKHPTTATTDMATLKFCWYGQWNDRGQVFLSTVNVKLFDALQIATLSLAPTKQGEALKSVVEIVRQGGEAQPVALKFTGLPAGVTAPDGVTIPAAESKVEVPITISADAAPGKTNTLVITASTKLGDKEFSIASAPIELEILPK